MKLAATRYRRRDLFSNPGAQGRIVLIFLALAVLFAATNYHVARRVFDDLSGHMNRLPLSPENRIDISLILEQQARTVDLQLSVLTFLAVFTLLMGGVLLSHGIGGPVHQLRAYLEEMAAGAATPRPIRFRKYDFFHDLARSFNKFQRTMGMLRDEVGAGEDRIGSSHVGLARDGFIGESGLDRAAPETLPRSVPETEGVGRPDRA